MKKIYVAVACMMAVCVTGFAYNLYSSKQNDKLSIQDSIKYFNIALKLQDSQSAAKVSIHDIENMQTPGYNSLSRIILLNQGFKDKKTNLITDLIEKNIKDKKSDKLLRDLTTFYYGKILLSQKKLELFEKYILPEISRESFAYHDNGLELIALYNFMSKKYDSLTTKINNIKDSPDSLKARLQILDREAKILLKKQGN